jgi:hypothetical protein
VILGVLAEIAHGYSFFQLFRQFVVQLVFEDRNFLGQLLLNVLRHTSESTFSGQRTCAGGIP